MCVRRYRIVIDVKVDTKGCVLDEEVVSLGFELGVENSVVETERVLTVF